MAHSHAAAVALRSPDTAALSKLASPDPVNPLGDHDLGMLAIADIAAEETGPTLPIHRLTGTPNRGDLDHDRAASPSVALTCLARRAGW